jgi:hypothetical protein
VAGNRSTKVNAFYPQRLSYVNRTFSQVSWPLIYPLSGVRIWVSEFEFFPWAVEPMVFEHIEQLKRDWTDKYVVVDGSLPELRRFVGLTGTVKTVNYSGRALVEFDGNNNIGWYDIDTKFLKQIAEPLPKAVKAEKTEKKAAPAKAEAPAAAKPAAKAPAGGSSVADILAAARGGAKPAAAAPAAGAKPSTADILAAARAKSAAPAADKPAAAAAPAKAAPAAGLTNKASTADILAAARAKAAAPKAEATPPAPPAAPPPAPEPTAPAAVEKVAAKPAAKGALPKDPAGIVAYCRKADTK